MVNVATMGGGKIGAERRAPRAKKLAKSASEPVAYSGAGNQSSAGQLSGRYGEAYGAAKVLFRLCALT